MKLAAMQPYFFPYLGYFQLIHAADKFILYDRVGYIRHGWVNRNRLLERHRGVCYIGVPICKPAVGSLIRDIRIDNTQPWSRTILRFLWHNYRPCAAFEEIYPLVQLLLSTPYETLSEVNSATIRAVCRWLSISTPVIGGGDQYESLERALNNEDTHPDRKTRRVLALCRAEKADSYLNAPGGQALYQPADFEAAGLTLQFLHPGDTPYLQASVGKGENDRQPFFPRLSILDVLMNCGLAHTRQLLDDYTLSGGQAALSFPSGREEAGQAPAGLPFREEAVE